MASRSSGKRVRVVSVTGGCCLLFVVTAADAAGAAPSRKSRVVATAPEDAAAIERALKLLPRRPETVAIMDPEDATADGRRVLAKADAFITEGGRIVYVNRESEVLAGARRGSSLYVCMLAAILWHELAHIDGADEAEAQKREEGLWKRFLLDNRVERAIALRYLEAMTLRR